jgi:hypothetical protein
MKVQLQVSGVLFDNAFFYGDASFKGAAFSDQSGFVHTIIQGRAEFTAMSAGKWRDDLRATVIGMNSEAGRALEQRHQESWAFCGCHPDRFLGISFANALFGGEATFFGRSFEKITDFINVRFYSPPNFDSATNLARIDFTGAHVGFVGPGRLQWTSDSKVPLRLRAFRKVAEETKNHDLERDLYIEERKAERGVYWHQLVEELKKAPEELKKKLEDIDRQQREVWPNWRHRARARRAHRLGIAVKIAWLAVHGFWIGVMGLYWALADYGRNFLVPAIWLGLSVPFFDWRYTEVLARLMAKAPDVDKYKQAVGMLALGNAVPFVGPLTIDAEIKKFLFCPGGDASCLPPIPPEGFQALVIAQNVLSIILVFFVGLALRNYFRIK